VAPAGAGAHAADAHAHRARHHHRRGHHPASAVVSLPRFPQSTFIADTFGGSTVTQVTCDACHNVSSRVEPFNVLSLALPTGAGGPGAASVSSASAGGTAAAAAGAGGSSLLACLAAACTSERLEGDSAYLCERCDAKRPATKRLLLHKLPPALVIHVNRAQWGWKAAAKREKVQSHVPFPTTLAASTDLAPFLSSEAASAYGAGSEGVGADAAAGGVVYRLVAVVVHQGRGIDTGHYTAYCRDEAADAWVLYDDHTVAVRTLGEVLKVQAYLLVYEMA
jgi:ubiquitin C-terminal hydrolase